LHEYIASNVVLDTYHGCVSTSAVAQERLAGLLISPVPEVYFMLDPIPLSSLNWCSLVHIRLTSDYRFKNVSWLLTNLVSLGLKSPAM
jgi:hypothetical protein